MSRAIIVGSQGQDGSFLFEQLAARNDTILGIDRQVIRTHQLPPADCPREIEILDPAQVADAVRRFQPDEIYYLAAFHHAADDPALSDSLVLFEKSYDIHVRGLLNFLAAALRHAPRARLFYAASSHLFGEPPTPVQDENTPLRPRCVYGITKTAATHCCRFFRLQHGLYTSVGFLYNHESHLRDPGFLSQKIVRSAVAMKLGSTEKLALGNLSAVVDWGYAPDYVNAMTRILQLDTPDDFIIASGQPHTVRDFVAAAFSTLGLDWQNRVVEDSSIVLKAGARLIGNSAKLQHKTGWKPSVTFEQMVAIIVAHEARRQGLAL